MALSLSGGRIQPLSGSTTRITGRVLPSCWCTAMRSMGTRGKAGGGQNLARAGASQSNRDCEQRNGHIGIHFNNSSAGYAGVRRGLASTARGLTCRREAHVPDGMAAGILRRSRRGAGIRWRYGRRQRQ